MPVKVGVRCGLCVASGERSGPGIPGPVEDLPVYEGHLLHAIVNMRDWPQYVEGRMGYDMSTLRLPHFDGTAETAAARNLNDSVVGVTAGDQADPESIEPSTTAATINHQQQQQRGRVRCVVIIRDPLSRLRSLYTYARSGGEHWFRYESGLMGQLGNSSLSLQQSLDFFWQTFGRGYLVQSHEYSMMNLDLGCVPVKMEWFKEDYSGTVQRILRAYGISEAVIPSLSRRITSDADASLKTEEQRKADAHFTANKFSARLIREINERLAAMEEVQVMVTRHRSELGYSASYG